MKLATKILPILLASFTCFAKHAFGLQSPKYAGEMQNMTMRTSTIQTKIGWDASETPGVTYLLYSQGSVVAATSGTSVSLGLKPNTTYTFVCTSIDSHRVESQPSNTLTFTTPRKNQSWGQ